MPDGTLVRAPLPIDRPRSRPRKPLAGQVVVSAGMHLALLVAVLSGLPDGRKLRNAADTPATVELVMTPPGTSDKDAAAASPQPGPETKQLTRPALKTSPTDRRKAVANLAPPASGQPAPQTATEKETAELPPPAPATEAPKPDSGGATAPPVPPSQPPARAGIDTGSPAPEPVRPEAEVAASRHQATPAATPSSTFSMSGIASDTNAFVTGDLVSPATADPRFHNRKPSYPVEAVRRGEQGTVDLLIHVSPDGLVTWVDIASSSGFKLLDQAAQDAAQSWRFLPAKKDGRPTFSEVPFRMVFDLGG